MSRPRVVPRRLIVEARDLDTDARTRSELEVEAPTDAAGQRAQLAVIVGQLHPLARMRSFDDGAASFLDSSHLVVAHYADSGISERQTRGPTRSDGETGSTEQQPLFIG